MTSSINEVINQNWGGNGMTKRWLWLFSALWMLGGCSQLFPDKETANENTAPLLHGETMTVTISTPQWMSNQEYENWIVKPLAERHPEMELNRIIHDSDLKSTSDSTPDLVLLYTWQLPNLERNQWAHDLEPLIKRYDFDLEQIETSNIETVRASNVEKLLIALPVASDFGALYYNKDIFDAFHVPYPKNNMTWPEVIELTKLVTRNRKRKTVWRIRIRRIVD